MPVGKIAMKLLPSLYVANWPMKDVRYRQKLVEYNTDNNKTAEEHHA